MPKMAMPKLSLPKFRMPPLSFKGGKLPGFFSLGPVGKTALAIEIGEDWLKLAAAAETGKNERKILWTACEPSRDIDAFSLALKVAQIVKSHHMKPSRVLVSFPSRHLTTRILSLPSTDPVEIADIVSLQAVKQTPYAREEITAGYHKIDSDASGYSRIFLAIAHRDQPSQYFRTAEMAFLLPDQIVPAVEGLRFWTKIVFESEAEKSQEPVLILEVDEAVTELLVVAGNNMIFTRGLGIGSKQLQEQAGTIEPEFLREVQRSLESDETLKQTRISRIIVTGVSQASKTAAAILSREMDIPCEVLPCFEPARKSFADDAAESISKSPVSFAALTGLLLSPEISEINLMPDDVRLRKGLEQRARELAFMGTLLLTIVMLGSLIGFEKIYKRTVYLDYLKKEYAAVRAQAEDVERLIGKIKLAAEQTGGKTDFQEVLFDINTVLPDSLILTSIDYNDREKTVLIRGTAREMSSVFQFLSTLESTPSLEQVKTRNVTKRKAGEQEVSEFEIAAVLAAENSEGGKP